MIINVLMGILVVFVSVVVAVLFRSWIHERLKIRMEKEGLIKILQRRMEVDRMMEAGEGPWSRDDS